MSRPLYQEVTTTGTIVAAFMADGGPFKTVYLRISDAPTGTSPSLTVALQGSADGENWATLGSFPAQTAQTPAGTVLRLALEDVFDPWLRVVGTVEGTFTGVYADVLEQ